MEIKRGRSGPSADPKKEKQRQDAERDYQTWIASGKSVSVVPEGVSAEKLLNMHQENDKTFRVKQAMQSEAL
jgi:hypothetical protein